MPDLTSRVPEIPATSASDQARAIQESARKETDPAQSEQSAPAEQMTQTQESAATNGKPDKDDDVDARTRANRANAQNSTGAKTPAGRAASAKNAAKHCLFAANLSKYFRTQEESERYQRFIDGIVKDLEPVGEFENVLARRAADLQFRLDMLRTAEFQVYAGGGIVKDTMEGWLIHSEDPMGLASLYDSRLQRGFTKTMEELRRVQQARRDKQLQAVEQLKGVALAHIQQNAMFDPAKFGFVISRDFIFNQAHLASVKKLAQFAVGNGVVEKKVVDYVAKLPPKAA